MTSPSQVPDNESNIEENALFYVSFKIILRNQDDSMLLLNLPPKSAMAGYYDLPGGRIRKGEERIPIPKIMKREIEEELGNITFELRETPVSVGRHFYISAKTGEEKKLFWVFFEAKYIGGTLNISDEHTGYEWVHITADNVKKYFTKGILDGMWSYVHNKFYQLD